LIFLLPLFPLSGCAEPFDVGETIYGAPLLDDMDGDGKSDVIVATMNGNVLCLSTPWPHHPLMTWPSAVPGGNNPSARANWAGVYVTGAARGAREASGETFPVQFTVVDARPGASKAATRVAARRRGAAAAAASAGGGGGGGSVNIPGPYQVTVTLRVPGRAPEVTAATYGIPGTYTLALPVPRVRGAGTVTVQLQDAFGLVSTDSYAVTFHTRYARLLKWLLVAPFTAMALALASGSMDALPAGLGAGGAGGASRWGVARAAQD
jgi:hypothetical protein